jgi:hypothetical protein
MDLNLTDDTAPQQSHEYTAAEPVGLTNQARITFRVSKSERAQLEIYARGHGVTLSEIVMEAIYAHPAIALIDTTAHREAMDLYHVADRLRGEWRAARRRLDDAQREAKDAQRLAKESQRQAEQALMAIRLDVGQALVDQEDDDERL